MFYDFVSLWLFIVLNVYMLPGDSSEVTANVMNGWFRLATEETFDVCNFIVAGLVE